MIANENRPGGESRAVASNSGLGASDQYITKPEPDEASERLFEFTYREELRTQRAREKARETLRAEKAINRPLPELQDLDNFLRMPDEDPAYLIDGLWPTGGRVVLAAQHKAGKTTLVANAIRALSTGDPFLGQFEVVPIDGELLPTVTLIDDELDERQLRRWLRDQQIPAMNGINVLALRGQISTFNVLDPVTRSRWAEVLSFTDVLILDCLRPLLDALGLDENRDAGRLLEALDELTHEAGVSELMVVHHTGHEGQRSRGDSRIQDWPDAIWKLSLDSKDAPNGDAPRFFSAYGRDVDVTEEELRYDPLARRLSISGNGSRKQAAAARLDVATKEQIMEIMARPSLAGGVSGNELSTLTGRRDADFTKARDALVEAGQITKQRRPGRGGGALYVLNNSKVPNIPKGAEPVRSEHTEHPLYRRRDVQEVSSDPNLPRCKVCGFGMSAGDGATTHPDCGDGA
ncbi:MAG: ATP-binding protein [Brooklawnia sp.]